MALFVTGPVVEPLLSTVRLESMMPPLVELPLAAVQLYESVGCSEATVALAHTEAMAPRLEPVAALQGWVGGCVRAAVAMELRLVVWTLVGKHWRYQQAVEVPR